MTTFRDATPADLNPLADLINSAYRGDSSRVGWTTEADLLDGRRTDADMLADELAAGGTIVVAEAEGIMAGCMLLDDGANHGHPDATYVGMVTVRPFLQGSGLGRELLAEAERRAVADGKQATVMTVISLREELIAWYQRRGYEPTGERAPFPYDDDRFGVPQRDDLEFVVLRKPLN